MEKIVQIMQREGSSAIFGLGADSRIYIWNASTAGWDPFWDTNSGEVREQQFRPINHDLNSSR